MGIERTIRRMEAADLLSLTYFGDDEMEQKNVKLDWSEYAELIRFLREALAARSASTQTDEKFERLRRAVYDLYWSANWTADREVDEDALWDAVRDAAGLETQPTLTSAEPKT